MGIQIGCWWNLCQVCTFDNSRSVAIPHKISAILHMSYDHSDGLVQEICNSSALAMELCLSFTKPSKWSYWETSSVIPPADFLHIFWGADAHTELYSFWKETSMFIVLNIKSHLQAIKHFPWWLWVPYEVIKLWQRVNLIYDTQFSNEFQCLDKEGMEAG